MNFDNPTVKQAAFMFALLLLLGGVKFSVEGLLE
jgi:hypothetical protein